MNKKVNYYNTTELDLEELNKAISNARTQDKKILSYFNEHPDKILIASELWTNLFDVDSVPLTSIRRSINTLYNKGLIDRVLDKKNKPRKRVCSIYGKKVFVYKKCEL